MSPLVSVCITTFQHEAFIGTCVESVLNQAFDGSVEVIVGDDGSTDGTVCIVQQMAARDSRLTLVARKNGLGPSRNLADLVARAGGDYIAHLDGDDLWKQGKLAAQLRLLQASSEVVACYTNADVLSVDGQKIGAFNHGLPPRIDRRELLRRGNMLNHSSLIYRASAAHAVLGIEEEFIDYRVHLRLLAHGEIGYLDEALVGYRWRSPTSMISTLPAKVIDGYCDALQEGLSQGASPSLVRAAAGVFWGKVVVRALLSRDTEGLRYAKERLLTVRGLGIGTAWFLARALRSPIDALVSMLSRVGRMKVYFP